MRRLLLFATLCLAASAHASWVPRFDTNWVTMRPGEKQTVGVSAVRLGFAQFPFAPMSFDTANPRIAIAKGSLTSSSQPGTITVEAKKPGVTTVVSAAGGPDADFVYVVVGDETPPRIAATALTTAPGQKVLLTVLFPFPEWASIEWFEGPTRERLALIGAGHELMVRPTRLGTHTYWAMIYTPWATSSAAIDIEVAIPSLPSRRRSVRH